MAIANIQNTSTGRLSAYNGTYDGSIEVSAPTLYNRYSGYGWASSLTIQNADALPATVEVVYNAGGPVQRFIGLAPGQDILLYQPNVDGLPLGWQGSVSVRSTDGRRLIAVVNEEAQGAGAPNADWLVTYVGTPR